MKNIRVIPTLLLHQGGLVKSIQFKQYQYIGDPINAVKIFNEKEIDEIIILDIDVSAEKRAPDLDRIKDLCSEAFIPLAYGGGISDMKHVEKLLYAGVEKLVFNHAAIHNTNLLKECISSIGSQSVVVSIDVKKNWFGKYRVYEKNGKIQTQLEPDLFSKKMEDIGVGELFVNSIDRDGTYGGYDINLISTITKQVTVPVIACGGASGIGDFSKAVSAGASAVAAGSMFVFQRPHQAVLISYPERDELTNILFNKNI